MADHDYRSRTDWDRDKYRVEKSDGTPKDPRAAYVPLRIDADPFARIAFGDYARGIYDTNPDQSRAIARYLADTAGDFEHAQGVLAARVIEKLAAATGTQAEPLYPQQGHTPDRGFFFLGVYDNREGRWDLYLVHAYTNGKTQVHARKGLGMGRTVSARLRQADLPPPLEVARRRALLAGLVAPGDGIDFDRPDIEEPPCSPESSPSDSSSSPSPP